MKILIEQTIFHLLIIKKCFKNGVLLIGIIYLHFED